MKKAFLFFMVLTGFFTCFQNDSFDCYAAEEKAVNDQSPVELRPILSLVTLDYGRGIMPFSVKNTSGQNISVTAFVTLQTLDSSGSSVSIDVYRNGPPMSGYGGAPVMTILGPNETGTFNSFFSMNTLSFLSQRKKEVFGDINGYVDSTTRPFEASSNPFPIPANLTVPPWVDLGEQTYFSITPDTGRTSISDTTEFRGGKVIFPVKVTNNSGQPYVAATNSIYFYVLRSGAERKPPSGWETIRTSEPILKPGESAFSTGRCYMTFDDLKSQDYKPGDQVVAAVGGRIPNTNQIFECYSAPFELPPLPESHSAK